MSAVTETRLVLKLANLSDNKIQKSFQSRLKKHTHSEPMTSLQHLYSHCNEVSFGKLTLISTVFGFK